MYQHLLVATDGTKLSEKAVTHAIALAQAVGARLTAFYASPGYPTPVYGEGSYVVPMPRKAAAGIDFNSTHVIAEAPWEAILAAARKGKCDAIVMASHGRRGLSALSVRQ